MIDVRELQKRGVVQIPKKHIPATSEEFIEMKNIVTNKTSKTNEKPLTTSNSDFFGFMNNPRQTNSEPTQTFSTETTGYNKREVDTKITDLDNKIYKLEQRIELLEKKLNVNQPTSNIGTMGW